MTDRKSAQTWEGWLTDLSGEAEARRLRALGSRNLSVRLPLTTHVQLYRIAHALHNSVAGTAAEVLERSVGDVYRTLGMPPIQPADINRFTEAPRGGDDRE